MRVLVTNNSKGVVHYWAGKYEGHHLLGHLYSPDGWRTPVPWLPYALDNGAFGAYRSGRPWDASAFVTHLERAYAAAIRPLWVVVPDVVANREATIARWSFWSEHIRATYDFPLAFAVQDGMTPGDVPTGADVVFVGGSTDWKRATIATWCRHFPRVHVARINTGRWLWYCWAHGVESVDGTGWFRGCADQLAELATYLDRRSRGEGPEAHLVPSVTPRQRQGDGQPLMTWRAPVEAIRRLPDAPAAALECRPTPLSDDPRATLLETRTGRRDSHSTCESACRSYRYRM